MGGDTMDLKFNRAAACIPPCSWSNNIKSLQRGKNSKKLPLGCSTIIHPFKHTASIINKIILRCHYSKSDKNDQHILKPLHGLMYGREVYTFDDPKIFLNKLKKYQSLYLLFFQGSVQLGGWLAWHCGNQCCLERCMDFGMRFQNWPQ